MQDSLTKVRNLTPHTVTVCPDGFPMHSHEPDPQGAARVSVSYEYIASYYQDGFPYGRAQYGAVENLPEPEEGVMLIVSLMVRQALPHRVDLCSPGDLIRDEQGRPVACRMLVCNDVPLPNEVLGAPGDVV